METTGKKPTSISLGTTHKASDILNYHLSGFDFSKYFVIVSNSKGTLYLNTSTSSQDVCFKCINCSHKYFYLNFDEAPDSLLQVCAACKETYEVYENELIKFYKIIKV